MVGHCDLLATEKCDAGDAAASAGKVAAVSYFWPSPQLIYPNTLKLTFHAQLAVHEFADKSTRRNTFNKNPISL